MDFSQIIIVLPILLFSVIVHEIAHGWTALRCGDPTARDAGRLTFNPVPHIDPFMTVILPLILIVSGTGFVIGGGETGSGQPLPLPEGGTGQRPGLRFRSGGQPSPGSGRLFPLPDRDRGLPGD